jgi:predicted phage terminase large subunit-like protein
LSDHSVCTTWLVRGKNYYLIDLLRKKLLYPDLKRTAVQHALEFQANVILIEDKGSGTSLIQDLLMNATQGIFYPIGIIPEGDKITRMSAQSLRIEAGHVVLPRGALWLDEFRSEILQFPYGKHDDQVDSMSQFLNWVCQRDRYTCTVEDLLL